MRRGAYALSPDGNWIYFGVQYDEQGQQGGLHGAQTDVYRLPATGGKPKKLFSPPALKDPEPLYRTMPLKFRFEKTEGSHSHRIMLAKEWIRFPCQLKRPSS